MYQMYNDPDPCIGCLESESEFILFFSDPGPKM